MGGGSKNRSLGNNPLFSHCIFYVQLYNPFYVTFSTFNFLVNFILLFAFFIFFLKILLYIVSLLFSSFLCSYAYVYQELRMIRLCMSYVYLESECFSRMCYLYAYSKCIVHLSCICLLKSKSEFECDKNLSRMRIFTQNAYKCIECDVHFKWVYLHRT